MPVINEVVIYKGKRAIVTGFDGWSYMQIECEGDKNLIWVYSKQVIKTGEFIGTPIASFELGGS